MKHHFKWLLPSTIYAASVNVLTLIVKLLYAHHDIRDVTSVVFLFVIYITAAVAFPYVKGDDSPPLLYNLAVLLIHIALSAIIFFLVLGQLYFGWEVAMFFYTEIFSIIFFVVVLLLDTIVYLFKRCSK